MLNIVNSCIGTKFTMRFGSLIAVRGRGTPTARAGRLAHLRAWCACRLLLAVCCAAWHCILTPDIIPLPCLPQDLALDAVQTVKVEHGEGRREIDIK